MHQNKENHVKTRIYTYMSVYTLILGVFWYILCVFCVFPVYFLCIYCVFFAFLEGTTLTYWILEKMRIHVFSAYFRAYSLRIPCVFCAFSLRIPSVFPTCSYAVIQTLCSIDRKTHYFRAIALQTLCSITNPMFNYKPYVQLQTLC